MGSLAKLCESLIQQEEARKRDKTLHQQCHAILSSLEGSKRNQIQDQVYKLQEEFLARSNDDVVSISIERSVGLVWWHNHSLDWIMKGAQITLSDNGPYDPVEIVLEI